MDILNVSLYNSCACETQHIIQTISLYEAEALFVLLCSLDFRAGCQMSICLFYWLVNSIKCKQLFIADLPGLLNYSQERRHTRHLNCQPGWKVGGWKCQRSPSGKILLLRVAFTQLMTVGVFYVSPPPIYGHWTIGHVIFSLSRHLLEVTTLFSPDLRFNVLWTIVIW